MKISDITGKQLAQLQVKPDPTRPHPECSVGIEVELEGININSALGKLWAVKREGSLQNGVELVSVPVWGTGITQALDELDRILKKKTPYLSFRTSVHIHINVLDLTPAELEWFVTLYLFYEPALFRLHEEWSRYENIFCVPAKKSFRIQEGYAALLRDIRNDHCQGGYVDSKYAALNPNSIAVFGTLEFRHMGGCYDTKKISDWINVLLQMKMSAINQVRFDAPDQVFGKYLKTINVLPSDLDSGWDMVDFINVRSNS
jgi:hypothetical protein